MQWCLFSGAASIDSALRYWEEALQMKTTQDGEPTVSFHLHNLINTMESL